LIIQKVKSCNYFLARECRSCPHLELSPEKERELKSLADEQLWGSPAKWHWVQTPFYHRTKAKFAVGGSYDDPLLGYPDIHIGEVIDINECPLHKPIIQLIAHEMLSLIKHRQLTPYDLRNTRGEFKYFHVITNQEETEVILRFVMRSLEARERIQKAVADLQALFPQIVVATINLQPQHKAVLEGEKEIYLTERKSICENYNGMNFHIGPRSFFQVTPEIANPLYLAVENFVKENKIKTLLDLYCGIGGFALHAARAGAKSFGAEINPEAISFAQLNAQELGFKDQSTFVVMDADKNLEDKVYDAILVNPPRRGLSDSTISYILKQSPEFFIYSSCTPEKQFEDWKKMEHEYQMVSREAYDMFPHTHHYESLLIAKRIN